MTLKEKQNVALAPASDTSALLPAEKRRSAWPEAALLFVLALVMNVPYLGMTPLAGTEGHRALTAHEMVRSGQWLLPILYGRPYLAKPPLHYWFIAAAESAARAAAHLVQGVWHGQLVTGFTALVGQANVFVWRMPSAIEGGVLCAVVCLFAARWFGRGAGFVAGACALGMIALWGERQVTDIDVTNTLCATIAALFGIEVLFGRALSGGAKPAEDALWPWVLGAGLGLGGTLMTKGPAGLPIIVGVWGWAAWQAIRARQADRLKRPRFWVPLAIGIGLFAGYALAAHWYIRHCGLPIDTSGVVEGLTSLYPDSFAKVRKALLLPGYLLVFAVPVSLALPLWYAGKNIREAMDERESDKSGAIAAAVPIAWVVCLISGMTNPRYGYPTLPLLCPLAGAVAITAARLGGNAAEWVRRIAAVAAVALAGASVFLAKSAWGLSHARPALLTVTAALAVAIALIVVTRIARSWSAGAWLLPLIVLASVPFGIRQSLARTPISGLFTAEYINQIAGASPRIAEGMALTYKPEIFYYARARATAVIPKFLDPAYIQPGTWLYMDKREHDRWKREVGEQLNHEMLINPGGQGELDFYFGWYGPKDDPAAKLADNAPAIAPTARGRK